MRKYIDLLNESLTEDEILDEMPMSNVSHVGNWEKNSSFGTQDRKLLTNPKAITKIKAAWKYPEDVNCNIILLNDIKFSHDGHGTNHGEKGIIGKIPEATQWIENNMASVADQIVPLLRSDEVNIVYLNNRGDARVPMTGWILAHRYGHALSRFGKSYYFDEAAATLERYLGELAAQYGIKHNSSQYSQYKMLTSTTTRTLMQAICTFKSARDKKLRNTFEAVHELFAQYIFTGNVKFNDIPRSVRVGPSTYGYRGGDDYDSDNGIIADDLAYELVQFFETAVHYSVGQTLIM